MHMRTFVIAVGVILTAYVAAAAPASGGFVPCGTEGGSNKFTHAVLVPRPSSASLTQRLAATSDYGDHAPGWLVQRLFALDDDVEFTGELVAGSFEEVPGDGDLVFSVKLSVDSCAKLQTYFVRKAAAPAYVHVEMVKTLSGVAETEPFRTWKPTGSGPVIRFGVDEQPDRPIEAAGSVAPDWAEIKAMRHRFVKVGGPLVVDILGANAGSGQVEIHPAGSVRISATPF